jgi:hypothetical protein
MIIERPLGALLCTALVLCSIGLPASAQVSVPMTVVGNTASGSINLAGIGAEITLRFDDVSNLSSSTLGVTARLVDPLDPTLLSRLPDPTQLSIPASFPLMITIEPPALGGLSLRNTVSVEIHTTLLAYSTGTALRLFKAQLHGPFEDITTAIEPGSVRARGATPEFSQFLILVDTRDRFEIAESKLTALESRASGNVADSTARTVLLDQLAIVRDALEAEDYGAAVAATDTFVSLAGSYAGSTIANQWRALRDQQNIAGALVSEATSLRHALTVLRDP